MKTCNKCKIEKELVEFNKDKFNKDKLKTTCKNCSNIEKKKYYQNNKEKKKEYYKNNKEKIALRKKEHYNENKEYYKERNKNYKENNKEKIKLIKKEYSDKNTEKMIQYRKNHYHNNKEYYKEENKKYREINKEKLKDKRRIYEKERRKDDFLFKSKKNIKCLIRNSFKIRGYNNQSRIYEILGCSYDEFKIHIESQFEPWMNWNNHGLYNGELNYGWDIDHIIPLSSAKTEEDVIKLNHYTNLQPLCSKVNRFIKRNSLDFL